MFVSSIPLLTVNGSFLAGGNGTPLSAIVLLLPNWDGTDDLLRAHERAIFSRLTLEQGGYIKTPSR